MNWRLGLDFGTNSIGWCVIELDENGKEIAIIDMGVRLFHDGREKVPSGKIGDSLATERRLARGMRRNRDRRLMRKEAMARFLKRHGLFMTDFSLDPYYCRAKAVTGEISKQELARALFHLTLRRGFKSNRKTDGDSETDFKTKIKNLRDHLKETSQTLGEYLWQRQQSGEGLRFRGLDDYNYYPDRQIYLDEFHAIKDKQCHHFSKEQWDKIEHIIFHQRPLKPVERGKCQFFSDQPRAYLGLPIAQDFRIAQEVNNLKWLDSDLKTHDLDSEQRHSLYEKLHEQKTLSWSAMRKLKRDDGNPLFPKHSLFNFEDKEKRRKGFDGNKIQIDMVKQLGPKWASLDDRVKNDLIEALYELEDEEAVIEKMEEYGFDDAEAEFLSHYRLPSATAKLSRKFMEQVTPLMLEQGLRYDEAVLKLGLHHSYFEDGEAVDRLPYYGQVLTKSVIGENPDADPITEPEKHFGKIGNPTVHIALNQLRHVVNSLIDLYGTPANIHLEVGRDLKQSRQNRDEISKRIKQNEKENKRIAQEIETITKNPYPSMQDIKKYKLWEELGKDKFARLCPFSGQSISAAMLFNGDVEVEHILPFSLTKDNGMSNLTLATRQANQIKSGRAPFDARHDFANQGWDWQEIVERVKDLPEQKRKRFGENALADWQDEDHFINSQLTDNSYISRIASQYLAKLVQAKNIVCVSGKLTALLRGKWKLSQLISNTDKKTRDDHRHHAIDAMVVGLTTRSIIQRISTYKNKYDSIDYKVPDLSNEYSMQAADLLDKLYISVKPDHGHNGKFYKETAYGFVNKQSLEDEFKDYNAVFTKPLYKLSANDVLAIRDPNIRKSVIEYLDFHADCSLEKIKEKDLKDLLNHFGTKEWLHISDQDKPMRNIRILIKKQNVKPGMIPSAPYKGYEYDQFACCDIYRLPKGKKGKWRQGEYIYQGVFWNFIEIKNLDKADKKPHPAAKFIMRLYKDDMVAIKDGEDEKIMRVFGFSTTNNKLDLRPQWEADAKQKFFPINSIADKMKKIIILPNGRRL